MIEARSRAAEFCERVTEKEVIFTYKIEDNVRMCRMEYEQILV